MNPVFKKLNYKDQKAVWILNAPASFASTMAEMQEFCTIHKECKAADAPDFILVFLTEKTEIEVVVAPLVPQLKEDALLWIAYPKKSSKKYQSDISRDDGWQCLGDLGMEPVRMVAIDADWSALRFRKVEFIKTITRRSTMALSKEAKKRTTNPK